MPSSPTPPNAQTTVKQSTSALKHPQWTRKTPLLPTPPALVRQFDNINHCRQFISRPSPSSYNRNSTFSGPSTSNNNRVHQQPHIPGPYTARFNNQCSPLLPSPPYQHQQFLTRPYPQAPGHFTLQVYTYIPLLLPYPSQLITSL